MPIRNPFRRSGVDLGHDENRPLSRDAQDHGFHKTSVAASNPVDIKEPAEYKLCEINDSGVYLPPSPTEKKGFWHASSRSSTTSNHRSLLNDNEPFNISRESFDSYRRSFDISARSPVPDSDAWGRQSLESRRAGLTSRTSLDRRSDRPSLDQSITEDFEDVGLDEPKPQPGKKRGLFARFGDSDTTVNDAAEKTPSSHHVFHFTNRKRAQSGQGSELRSMVRSAVSPVPQVVIESR